MAKKKPQQMKNGFKKVDFDYRLLFLLVVPLVLIGIFVVRWSRGFNADVNNDGTINASDLSIISSSYGKTGRTFAQGDINGDGSVNITDLSILAINWGKSSATIRVIPSTIAHATTCSTSMPDVTYAIEDWLNSLPAGSVAQFGAGQCYRVELFINVKNKSNLTIDGNGALLQSFSNGCQDNQTNGAMAVTNPYTNCKYNPRVSLPNWPRNRSRLVLTQDTNLIINNLRVDGGNYQGGNGGAYDSKIEAQHGFDVNGGSGIILDSVQVDRVWGDYVYLQGQAKGVTVRNSLFGKDGAGHGNGRQGLTVMDIKDVSIVNNSFTNIRHSCIDFEPDKNGAVISNISIISNRIGNCQLNFISMTPYVVSGVPRETTMDGVFITNNSLIDESLNVEIDSRYAVDLNNPASYRWKNIKFIGNTSTLGFSTGSSANIRMSAVYQAVFKNNTVTDKVHTPAMVLVQLNKVLGGEVSGNKIINGGAAGRYIHGYSGGSSTPMTLVNKNICEKGNLIGPSGATAAPIGEGATSCP